MSNIVRFSTTLGSRHQKNYANWIFLSSKTSLTVPQNTLKMHSLETLHCVFSLNQDWEGYGSILAWWRIIPLYCITSANHFCWARHHLSPTVFLNDYGDWIILHSQELKQILHLGLQLAQTQCKLCSTQATTWFLHRHNFNPLSACSF